MLGRFAASARPIIRTHDDIFNYLVKSDSFELLEAVSVHLMELEFRRKLEEKVVDKNRNLASGATPIPLTADEIDQLIYNAYDARVLDGYKKDAANVLNQYVVGERARWFEMYMVPRRWFHRWWEGAWGGFLGNALTGVIGFFLILFIAVYQDATLKEDILLFMHKIVTWLNSHL